MQSRGGGAIAAPGFTQGAIDGLRLSWVNASTVQIGIGKARDSADAANVELTGTQNIDITASGINGLDTGSEATSTWYSVWIVSGSSGTGGLLSTSATAPTLPAGYDVSKRRLGWVYNHSDDDLQNFDMEGSGRDRTTWWHESGPDYLNVLTDGTSNGSWSEVDVSSRVPATADSMWVRGYSGAGGTVSSRVRPSDYTITAAYMLLIHDEARWGFQRFFCVDTKAIQYYSDSGTPQITIGIKGWKETI